MLLISSYHRTDFSFEAKKGLRVLGSPDKCLCGITKAMLAGILHSGFGSFVLSQPEKKKSSDFCKAVKFAAL